MIADLWLDIVTPSRRDERPYLWILIALGHAMLGAAIHAPLEAWIGATGWALAALRLAVGVLYWLAKERGDLARGGTVRDGIIDSVAVWAGTFYGAPWWPAAMLIGAGAGAILREMYRAAGD